MEDDNSRKYQSCSPCTCSFSKNASKEKSDFEIVVEGGLPHVDQIHITPKYLHEYIKLYLLEGDEQPSDLEGEGYTNLFFEECNQPITISVSEENLIAIQDQKYEDIAKTRHVEEMNNVYAETYKEHEVLKSEVLDEVVDVSPGNCHMFCLHGSFEDQFDSVQGNLQLGKLSHG